MKKPTINQFKNQIEARDSRQINRTTDVCDWYYKDIEIFHERSHWGFPRNKATTPAQKLHKLYKMANTELICSYWANVLYTDLNLAKQDASKFSGIVEQDFYCEPDNLTWFLIFNDLDKAAEFAYYQLNKENKL